MSRPESSVFCPPGSTSVSRQVGNFPSRCERPCLLQLRSVVRLTFPTRVTTITLITYVRYRAQRIQNLAYALIQVGIQPGDRVAVISPNAYVLHVNDPEFKLTTVACSPLIAGRPISYIWTQSVYNLFKSLQMPTRE